MEKPEVHAVELVRKIRDEHYLELQGKTTAERISYYQEQARRLHAKLAKKIRKHKTPIANLS